MSDHALETLLAEASQPYRRMTVLAAACASTAAIAGILLLALSGWFIAGAALVGSVGIVAVQGFNYLIPSAAIRLLAILRTAARYGERLLGHGAALLALARFRTRLFERLINRPMPDLRQGAGDAAAMLVQDVDALEDRFIRGPGNFGAAAGAAAALALTALAGTLAVLSLAAVMAIVITVTRHLARRSMPDTAMRIQTGVAALKQTFVDYAAASPEIAAFGLAASVEHRLQVQASQLDTLRRAFARSEALLAAIVAGAGGLAMGAVLMLSTASLPMTLLSGLAAAGGIEAIGALVRSAARDAVISASMERLSAMAAADPVAPAPTPRLAGKAVAVRTGSHTIHLAHGDRIAITGRSGAGKTTLLEHLAGLREAEDVHIEIDGAATRAESRRDLFAISPQDAAMLAGTIADNLRIARPGLGDEVLWQALDITCLSNAVRNMPDGLFTWVGDNGARLSGGQRKRLSIARAILAGRPWLLLDEPGEGLDPATSARLCANLKGWLDRTGTGLVIVTHRGSQIRLASRTLNLDS